jgi:hypothetical protein
MSQAENLSLRLRAAEPGRHADTNQPIVTVYYVVAESPDLRVVTLAASQAHRWAAMLSTAADAALGVRDHGWEGHGHPFGQGL